MTTACSPWLRGLACAVAVLGSGPAQGVGDSDGEAAALIVAVTGPLTVSEHGRETRPAAALDWLRAGAVVEPAAGATAVLALAGGRRYEITTGCRVRVSAEALDVLTGHARELPRFAPLPRLSLLSPDARAGSRAGALRVRGLRLRGLYPRADAATLAASAALAFSAAPGIVEYHVEVEDEEGATVFHATTRGSSVPVSPGVLQPGRRYRWSVRGSSSEGVARGEAEFITLDAEAAQARDRLRASVGEARDAASLTLLAEVDRSLGLLQEAHDGFTRALASAPGDDRLRQALAQVDARLREAAPEE